MRTPIWSLLGGGVLLYVTAKGLKWLRAELGRDVSHDWMVDNARRDWRGGGDHTPTIAFPIRKVVNEHGRYQAAKLRKRA